MASKYNFCQLYNVSMCVYKITNKLTGKSYIGKTRMRAKERWWGHVRASNKASSTYLARAISKYGADSFIFEVIDIAENDESLNHKENFYILHYNTLTPNGYNLTTGGEGGKLSEETKEKLSKIHSAKHGVEKGRLKTLRELTPEQRAARELQKSVNRSNAQKGRVSPRKGVKVSPETLEKMRLVRTGVPVFWCRKKVIRNDGEIYDTVKDAALDNNTTPPNIVAVLKGRRNLANGFQFRYLEECSEPWKLQDSYNKKNIPIGCSNGETYISQTVAANILGLQQGNIWKVLSGKRKSTGGLTFWYLDGDSTEQTDNKENLDGR